MLALHQMAAVCCGKVDVRLGVKAIPGFQPGCNGILLGVDHIKGFGFFQHLCQLFFDLALGLAENVLDNALACGGIVSNGVAAFPAPRYLITDEAAKRIFFMYLAINEQI